MTLAELKTKLTNRAVPNNFMVFVCEDNHFLVNQYLQEIIKLKGGERKINSIHDPVSSALTLVVDYTEEVNILRVETFDEPAPSYDEFTNTIVVCDKVDKKLEAVLKDHIVVFPKLLEWQVKDYMQNLCPSLTPEEINWLYETANGDIYRIKNELDKVALFTSGEQKEIFEELRVDPGNDLCFRYDQKATAAPLQQLMFTLSDAIIANEKLDLLGFLKHDYILPMDPIAIATMIFNKLKNTALVKFNSGVDPKNIGLSDGAVKWLRKSPLSEARVFDKLNFISSIDLRLKSSELDLSNNKKLDYILCRMAQ